MGKYYILDEGKVVSEFNGWIGRRQGVILKIKPEDPELVIHYGKIFDHDEYMLYEVNNNEAKPIDGIPNDIEKQIFDFEHRNDPPLIVEPDNVNHPSHYETGKFECIDVMLETQGRQAVINFCVCNAFKYLYRHGRKNGVEDLKKARWYLDKAIGLIEGTDDE